MLERIQRTASTPERLQAFLLLIKHELGYQLHEAVRTKFELSTRNRVHIRVGPVTIKEEGDAPASSAGSRTSCQRSPTASID
jgi:hypothetical protein